MIKGVAYTLSACFIWGLIFVIPTFLTTFSPLEVALGRYFFYGILSIIFFGSICFKNLVKLPLMVWLQAFWFALIVNIIYYTSLVLAIQYSSAALATLIAGISPLSISFYGNWKNKEGNFTKLIFPSILIGAGLLIANGDALLNEKTFVLSLKYCLGYFCAFLALGAWTWFVVANNQFLKRHSTITYFEWSTVLGVATLVWVFIIVGVSFFCFLETEDIQKYFIFNDEVKLFIICTAILGCICSWMGTFFWNSGCHLLPMSLSGQLTIFETIFGLSFVYLIEQRLPTYLEGAGMTLMLLAIIYSLNVVNKVSREPLHS